MKRAAIVFLLGLILSGCWCKSCRGQTAGTPWVNDTVVTSTEAQEFRRTCEDLLNYDPAGLIEILFVVATGSAIPSGTQTVQINSAQLNRWFNTADTGSFVSRGYWRIGQVAVGRKIIPRKEAEIEIRALAPVKINNQAKRERFIAKLDYLTGTSEEY